MSESIQAIPPFVDAPAPVVRRRLAARPTAREWARHTALFLLTLVTATFAGISLTSAAVEPAMREPVRLFDYVLYVPEYYARWVGGLIYQAATQPHILTQGVIFSFALLAILTAHEFGHYIACRRYGVDATLPFFIPAPPPFIAGTFGAFIKIKSPIPTRRALFDIGVAGPLAGFIVAVPVSVAGILTLGHATPVAADQHVFIFNDPLLFQIIARALHVQLADASSGPLYIAAWIGLLVTSLNLMPVGQLDGGHATYAVFGARAHKWLGRIAFATTASLAVLGWFWHGSPSGFLYTILLAVMLRMRHSQTEDEIEPLDHKRLIIAALTLLVFMLCFMPFPITIT